MPRKPKVTLRCPRCGKPYNPLSHVCRKRKRKQASPVVLGAGRSDGHEYDECDDPDCERFPCRVYREGRERGDEEGYERGVADGYAKGFADGKAAGLAEGFAAGVASVPASEG